MARRYSPGLSPLITRGVRPFRLLFSKTTAWSGVDSIRRIPDRFGSIREIWTGFMSSLRGAGGTSGPVGGGGGRTLFGATGGGAFTVTFGRLSAFAFLDGGSVNGS